MKTYVSPGCKLIEADCFVALKTFADASIDSVVTDPPYELGFMGKEWDGTGIAYSVELWREVLRVLKPGGHLLAFGATRTYHRMTCAIEDAGFEIRDSISWLYAQGFPKSLSVSKAIDSKGGPEAIRRLSMGENYTPSGRGRVNYDHGGGSAMNGSSEPVALSEAAKQWEGWGTAVKPAHEPIVMARKPLIGTVAANVLAHGTGALNIDGCRIGAEERPRIVSDRRSGANKSYGDGLGGSLAAGTTTEGRWPSNVLLDESAAAELDAMTEGKLHGASRFFFVVKGDPCNAHRFRYVAKPSRKERDTGGARNVHPTVKPVELMRYLVRLVTPPGGAVLDPFTGSGTTGMAARLEGFGFIGIEREPEYCQIAKARIEAALSGEKKPESA